MGICVVLFILYRIVNGGRFEPEWLSCFAYFLSGLAILGLFLTDLFNKALHGYVLILTQDGPGLREHYVRKLKSHS